MREGSGTAAGVGLGVFVFLLLLPFLLVVILYTFFTIYAMTKGLGFDAHAIDLGVLFSGVAVLTAALLLLLMGVVALAGRSMDPRKHRRRGR
ncbi:MAG TPA: hypothetical protein VE646_01255 [Actinomycetota bacterium]|jgi:hypothetical protein|nr:hypothetical protein [Actinomycetota bacterium]